MADHFINICQASVTECTVNGLNCRSIVHNVKIFESVCKPYITAQITFNNNRGQLNETRPLTGQSRVTVTLQDSTGATYPFDGIFTKAPDEFETHQTGEGFVTIHAITYDYWNDKRSLVTKGSIDEPGTALVQKIHNQYIQTPLRILEQSIGYLSRQEGGGYGVTSESPFTAIRTIGQKLKYGRSSAGATIYFREKNGHVFGPAQALVDQMGSVTEVRQSETIGHNRSNIWGSEGAKSILVSKVFKKEEAPDAMAVTASAGGTAGVNDYEMHGRFAAIGALGSAVYGLVSNAMRSEAHQPKAIHESTKTVAEWNYKAAFARAPNYLIKISIEAGMKCTVGKGIKATMMAPLSGQFNTVSGNFLIADLMHDCYFDNREITGTTTLRIVDPPIG